MKLCIGIDYKQRSHLYVQTEYALSNHPCKKVDNHTDCTDTSYFHVLTGYEQIDYIELQIENHMIHDCKNIFYLHVLTEYEFSDYISWKLDTHNYYMCT